MTDSLPPSDDEQTRIGIEADMQELEKFGPPGMEAKVPSAKAPGKDYAFLLRILGIFNGFNGPCGDNLFWRTDGKYAPYSIFVNCNDVFAYACADLEEITPDNVDVLDAAIVDCTLADPVAGVVWAPYLFCARVRKQRPLSSYFEDTGDPVAALFMAAGPERA